MGHIVSMPELAKLIHHRHPHRRLSLTLLYGTDPLEPPSTNAALSKIIASNPSVSFLHLPNPQPLRHHLRIHPRVRSRCRRCSLPHLGRRHQDTRRRARHVLRHRAPGRGRARDPRVLLHILRRRWPGPAPLHADHRTEVRRQGLQGLAGFNDRDTGPANKMPKVFLDPNDAAYQEFFCLCECLPKSQGILVNTFDELEPVTMAAIAGGACVPDGPTPTPPLYYIGPLIEASKDGDDRIRHASWVYPHQFS